MAEADDHVLRFDLRRLERRVPGIGPCVFVALGARAELDLARRYDEPDPDHRAFANDLIAAAIGHVSTRSLSVHAQSRA